MTHRLKLLGTLLAVAGTLVFLYFLLASLRFEDLRPHLNLRFSIALALASVLYGSTVALSALAWKRLLAGMSVRGSFRQLSAIMFSTQIGKYLPGNVGQIIGRTALAIRQGVPASAVAISVVYEILLLLVTGVLVAIAAAALSQQGLALLREQRGALAGAALLSIALLAAIPLAARLVPPLIARMAKRTGTADPRLLLPRGQMIAAMLLYAGAYLVIGASAAVLAVALAPDARLDFALLTAAFAIAWVVGFVTPGAPAGIGVREALLTFMLAPSMGMTAATVLILALRIATTLGDILCFLAGLALMPSLRGTSPQQDGSLS